MLKQPSRNQRSKGLKVKVKHGLHTCLLLAICIWLLYQVKQSYVKNADLDPSSKQILKLGRRDLNPLLDKEISSAFENSGHEEEGKLKENERERTEGGDDEIDEHDEEKVEEEEPEQFEDLIDEDDDDKEEEEENAGFLDNQDHSEVESSEKAQDELYKADDAASAVIHNTQIITGENK